MRLLARYYLVALALAAFVATGVFGYMGIERWTFFDALYMTILTFTTVGYQEVRPLSAAGRVFTTFLMIGGVATMLYTLSAVMQTVVEEELIRSFLRRYRMQSRLSKLKDHFIVCGFGRVGRATAETLKRESMAVAVIDTDEEALARARELGIPCVLGSATDDDSLRAARVDQARGLIAALGDDPDNVFVTLSARGMNPSLRVIARASSADSVTNLERAGADSVVSPHEIGGRQIAMSATRPLEVDFLDSLTAVVDDSEERLSEVIATEDSALCSAPIGESCAPIGVQVLAIRRGGKIIVNPEADQRCLPGDRVVLVGASGALDDLEGRGD